MDLVAPGGRRAHPRPLRRARRPTGSGAAALRRMGAPAEELEPLQNAAMPVRSLVDPVLPDVLLEDGDTARGAGLGPRRPSGRPVTRPATCASTSRATS